MTLMGWISLGIYQRNADERDDDIIFVNRSFVHWQPIRRVTFLTVDFDGVRGGLLERVRGPWTIRFRRHGRTRKRTFGTLSNDPR